MGAYGDEVYGRRKESPPGKKADPFGWDDRPKKSPAKASPSADDFYEGDGWGSVKESEKEAH